MRRSMLVGALLLAAGRCWALNPDGKGTLDLGIGDALTHVSEQGKEPQATFTYIDHEAYQQDWDWGGGGTVVLGDASTLTVSVDSAHTTEVMGRSVDVSSAAYESQRLYQGQDMAVGGRLYVASLCQRDWHPESDHPWGACLWPVLSAQVSGDIYSDHWSLNYNNGFTVTLPDDLVGRSLGLTYGLVYPLTQTFALDAEYFQDLWSEYDQGAFSATQHGTQTRWGLGGTLTLPWREADPSEGYFPRVGRPGRVRVDGHYSRDYDLVEGRISYEQFGLELVAPVNQTVALSAGWGMTHHWTGAYDGRPNFTLTQQNTDVQSLSAAVIVSFGDASKS